MASYSEVLDPRSASRRIARAALSLIPHSTVVPVLQGGLRGMRWVVGSSLHACWLGTFESSKQSLFREYVKAGDVVYDIGANVGFYTLMSSKLVGQSGRVFAFEPLPRNLAYLRQHVDLNTRRGGRCTANVTIIDVAVGDTDGTVMFVSGASHHCAHIAGVGDHDPAHANTAAVKSESTPVRVRSLDSLLAEEDPIPSPSVVKIDVEGAELMVLNGASITLRRHHPTIFLATHGKGVHRQCCDLLRSQNYSLIPIGGCDLDAVDELIAIHRAG